MWAEQILVLWGVDGGEEGLERSEVARRLAYTIKRAHVRINCDVHLRLGPSVGKQERRESIEA